MTPEQAATARAERMLAQESKWKVNSNNYTRDKFTNIQVSNIKEMLHEGIKQSDIAKMFNVSKSCINKIFKNKSYKNIRHAY